MAITLKSFFLMVVLISLYSCSHPAGAQYIGQDNHETQSVQTSIVATDSQSSQSAPYSSSASTPKHGFQPPLLQGTTPLAVGPSHDATVIEGVNTAGTVRINMLANLEALLNIGANGAEIIGILWGACLLFACIRKISPAQRISRGDSLWHHGRLDIARVIRCLAIAALPIIGGLAAPATINCAAAFCRDANLFS